MVSILMYVGRVLLHYVGQTLTFTLYVTNFLLYFGDQCVHLWSTVVINANTQNHGGLLSLIGFKMWFKYVKSELVVSWI